MANYHLHIQIIGRSSGRSTVAAAAYRAGEKIKNERDGLTHDYSKRNALSAAAYRSGEHFGKDNFSNKKGVIYSEIMLPKYAPLKYQDRPILWNAVEMSEKRKDAQLAREIVVALPVEFDRDVQIKILQEYIQENFVNCGMIADFSIHDKGDGNPHAHIMLTTRDVNENGFEKKNREWNKPEYLTKWREYWALTVNKELERLGISERIDHRTLEAQGIDRLPTIHLGYEASKLEKTGIKTHKGDINRTIGLINAEVARINARISFLEKQREIEHIRLISNPIKPKESVRDYIRNARAQDTRPNRNRPDRDKFSRDIEHER